MNLWKINLAVADRFKLKYPPLMGDIGLVDGIKHEFYCEISFSFFYYITYVSYIDIPFNQKNL